MKKKVKQFKNSFKRKGKTRYLTIDSMFTVAQMRKATSWKIRQNSKTCKTRLIRATMEIDKRGLLYRRALFHSWHTDGMRKVEIRLYGDLNQIGRYRTYIHCSCPYFLFHSEVALYLKGSSSIINSNGNLPHVTNPYLKPKLCKHAFSATTMLKRIVFKKNPKISEDDLEIIKNVSTFLGGVS